MLGLSPEQTNERLSILCLGAHSDDIEIGAGGAILSIKTPDRTGADVPVHDLDELYLVSSWFRRRPAELARVEPATSAAPR